MITTIFKILKTLIKFAVTAFCILLIAIILIQRFSNNQITLFGFRIFNVATESMVPKYNVGDILMVKEINPNDVKVGDDITYMGEVQSYAGKLITHQVIGIEEKNGEKIFHTKGIANPEEDPTIKGNQIYGKVFHKFITVSLLSNFISDMRVMYILLFVSIGFVMIMEIRDYKKMDDEYEDKDDIRSKKIASKMREKRRKRQQKQVKKEL